MTQFGAAAILVGLVLLATHAGSQSFAAIAASSLHMRPWVRSAAFVLVVIGFGSKAGAVPLHVWLPRAHSESSGPGVGPHVGGDGEPRHLWHRAGGRRAAARRAGVVVAHVMAIGALSALFGALHSATSRDPEAPAWPTRRPTTWGLVLLAVGASGLFAVTGRHALALVALRRALLHVVFHAVFKGCLFLSASSIQQATGTRDLVASADCCAYARDRVGLPRRGLAMAALPVLCGFVSEWLLLQSMLHGSPPRTRPSPSPCRSASVCWP